MIDIGAERLEELLNYRELVDEIGRVFASAAVAPERHHHTIPVPEKSDGTLLLMPAWETGGFAGVKTATIFPSNEDESLPSVMAGYQLLDAQFLTAHLAQFGALEIPRDDYVHMLDEALAAEATFIAPLPAGPEAVALAGG